jgi:hypothetical protein
MSKKRKSLLQLPSVPNLLLLLFPCLSSHLFEKSDVRSEENSLVPRAESHTRSENNTVAFKNYLM